MVRSLLHARAQVRTQLLLPAVLLLTLLFAGCIGSPEATPEGGPDGLPSAAQQGNQTLPEPQVFQGDAVLTNPAHFAYCLQNGIDGNLHALDGNPGGWRFSVAPTDVFVVYWFDEGQSYLGGGEAEGNVPADAAFAEVCQASGTGPADYTLEVIHGDHPDR